MRPNLSSPLARMRGLGLLIVELLQRKGSAFAYSRLSPLEPRQPPQRVGFDREQIR